MNFKDDPFIHMRPEKYDEKSARNHIRRVREILEKPLLLQSGSDNPKVEPEAAEEEKEPGTPTSNSSNPMVKNLGKVKLATD